jgi:hypothetical protein
MTVLRDRRSLSNSLSETGHAAPDEAAGTIS